MKRSLLTACALPLFLLMQPAEAQVNIYRCGSEFVRMLDKDAQAQKCTVAAGTGVAILEAKSEPAGLSPFYKYVDSLGGAATVAVVGALTAYWFDRRKKFVARKDVETQLCHALRGELRSLRGQLRFFLAIATQAKQNFITTNNEQEYRLALRQLSLSEQLDTRIFVANVQQVGALWQLMTREISEFYGDVQGLGIVGNAVGTASASAVGHQLDWFMYECKRLGKETITLAERLKMQAEGTYLKPDTKNLKAGGVFENLWTTEVIIMTDKPSAKS